MADKSGRPRKKSTITFGKPIQVVPPNIPRIQQHLDQNRKFKDDRLQELRKRMFRKDI